MESIKLNAANLRHLFWKHKVMARWRHGLSKAYRLTVNRTLDPVEFARWVFDDTTPPAPVVDILFYLEFKMFGDELWACVLARAGEDAPIRLVGPFMCPDYDIRYAPLFPEES